MYFFSKNMLNDKKGVIMKTILPVVMLFASGFLFLNNFAVASPLDLGTNWRHYGDSETDGRAFNDPSVVSQGTAFKTIWDSNFSTNPVFTKDGVGGAPLQGASDDHHYRYLQDSGRSGATWVHFQESGNQNYTGQRTPEEFATSFENFVRDVAAQSPNAIISTETAYSFERESESYRDWTDHNIALRAKVAELAQEGIIVHIADVDQPMKDLVSALGFSTVITSDGGHFQGMGNLMVALLMYQTLGYDIDTLDLSGIPNSDVSQAHKDIVLSILGSTPPSDTEAPTVPQNLIASSSNNSINFSWTASTDNVAVVGYRIYRDGVFLSNTSATSYSDTGLNSGTSYSYTVSAYDAAGNVSLESSALVATTTVVVDTEAPTVPAGLQATAISPNEITLSWTASTDNIAVTGYKVYRDGIELTTISATNYNDSGLVAETQYEYQVLAFDEAGNQSALSSLVFATTQVVPQSDYVISAGDIWKYFKGTQNPPIGWNTAVLDDGSWLSGATGIGYGDGDDATVLSDMYNNYTGVFFRKTFTNNYSNVTDMTLEIDIDDGFVAYLNGVEVARRNVSATTIDADTTADNGIEPGTIHVYDLSSYTNLLLPGNNVLAIAAFNNNAVSSDLTFIPALELTGNGSGGGQTQDEIAPTIPSSVSASAVSANQIDLNWTASSDNIGVAGYEIYRDGSLLTITAQINYSDNGLSPETGYSYQVLAFDYAGNKSTLSSVTSATTQALPQSDYVISVGDNWKYFKGTENPAIGWNELVFDDSSWLIGATNIGYGDGNSVTNLTDMYNNYGAVFTRKVFQNNYYNVTDLSLEIDIDDGFVAYLNGVEVARRNVSATTIDADTRADNGIEPGTIHIYDLAAYRNLLLPGNNVLAIAIFNNNLVSSDLTFMPALEMAGETGPQELDELNPSMPTNLVASATAADQIDLNWTASSDNIGVAGYRIYRDGTLLTITGQTNYSDTGLTAETVYTYEVLAFDFASNESALSSSASATTQALPESDYIIEVGDNWKYFKGTENPATGWNELVFDDSSWLVGATGIGYGDGDDATILADMYNNYAGVFFRKTFTNNYANVANMTLEIDIDDGFVAYLNGVEVARRNVSATTIDADTTADSGIEPGTVHVYDLSSYTDLLFPGNNVLAIAAFNNNTVSSDLTFIPALKLSE